MKYAINKTTKAAKEEKDSLAHFYCFFFFCSEKCSSNVSITANIRIIERGSNSNDNVILSTLFGEERIKSVAFTSKNAVYVPMNVNIFSKTDFTSFQFSPFILETNTSITISTIAINKKNKLNSI